MENSTISMLIEIFNILSTGVVAFFAVIGALTAIFTIYYKITNKQIPQSSFLNRKALAAFCFCCTAAFLFELTLFNYTHYLKHFADEEIYSVPNDTSTDIIMSDGSIGKVVQENAYSGIVFENINKKITSIKISPNKYSNEVVPVVLVYTDEESTRSMSTKLIRKSEDTHYIAIHPTGRVSNLKIFFENDGIKNIGFISINKQIPLFFFAIRILLVSALLFGVYLIRKQKPTLKKYLFNYCFDKNNKKQNIIYGIIIISLIIFSAFSIYTSNEKDNRTFSRISLQYQYLTKAIINGQLHLDMPVSQGLLDAENPYDFHWKQANNIDYYFDVAFYKGKYYCYFGIIPNILLYVPYYLITGKHLSMSAGILFFAIFAVVFLLLLWRKIADKYLENMQFTYFCLGAIALFLCSMFYYALRLPMINCLMVSASFAFSVIGLYFLFWSVEKEKISNGKLFFACLFLALAIGCRPTTIFISILVPVVLWKQIVSIFKNKENITAIFAIIIPYLIVGVPLAVYNFVRFDSFTQFGQSYMLTELNNSVLHLINPIGKAINIFAGFIAYLFTFPEISTKFPFFTAVRPDIHYSPLLVHQWLVGIFAFPFMWAIFLFPKYSKFIKKDNKEIWNLIISMLLISCILIVVSSKFAVIQRYMIDFAFLFGVVSLLISVYWTKNSVKNQKIAYLLCVASILMAFFLSFSAVERYSPMSEQDPVTYRYLERSFGIIVR